MTSLGIDFPNEIIVIDNNSNHNDYNFSNLWIKKIPKLNYKKSIINTGFGGGNMFGSQFASGDYLLFLNNDVVLK